MKDLARAMLPPKDTCCCVLLAPRIVNSETKIRNWCWYLPNKESGEQQLDI